MSDDHFTVDDTLIEAWLFDCPGLFRCPLALVSPLEKGILTMNIATDGFAVHEGLYPEIIPSRTHDLDLSSRLQGGYNLRV